MTTDFLRISTLALALTSLASLASAQDWPMQRHDSRRTAYQSVGVDIDQPGELFRVDLGGAPGGRAFWVRDADRDGRDEVYVVAGGRVVSLDGDGAVRWATTPLGLAQIHGFLDLNGDGRLELVASAARVSPMVFDALTGERLWQATLGPDQAVGDVLAFDREGDGRPELFISEFGGANGGHATGRVYAFPEGFSGTVSVTPLDTSAHGYWYGLGSTLADLDGDGRKEIVALSNDRAVAYDTQTGAPRWTTASLDAFPYGIARLNAVDVDGDGRDEVIAMSNNPAGVSDAAKRLMLLEVEGDTFARRWELRLDASLDEHRFIRDDVAVLRAGALPSIVTSIFDSAMGGYRTLIFAGDSSAATAETSLPDRVLLALADVDGDGVSELLTLDALGASPPDFGTIRALSLQPDGSFLELWHTDGAELAMEPVAFLPDQMRVVRGAAGTLVLRDAGGDRRADEVFEVGTDASYAVASNASIGEVRLGSGGHVWLGRSDGYFASLDSGLSLANDAVPGDGVPDLRFGTFATPEVASVVDGARMLVALVNSSAAPAVYDLAHPSEPLWRGQDQLAAPQPTLSWLPGSSPRLAYVAREADGTLALSVRAGGDGAEVVRMTYGTSVAQVPVNDLVPLLRADGTLAGVVGGAFDQRDGEVRYQLFDLEASTSMPLDLSRVRTGGEYPVTAHDWDGDGVEDASVMQVNHLRVASGVTGTRLLDQVQPHFGGMFSFVDLDGDGGLDVFHQGGFGGFEGQPGYGARRLTADLASVAWSFDQTNFHRPAALAPGTWTGMHIGVARRREAYFGVLDPDGTVLGSGAPASGSMYVDVASAEAAGANAGTLTGVSAVASQGGGRSASFVFGSTDGYLYAARASDGGLAWSFPMRASVGEPVPTDVDMDGRSELLVPAGDGALHVIGPALLAAPASVYDDDGMTVAGSAAADVDEITVSTLVGADWEPVDGATGYEVQLLRDDDFVVVPWVDVHAQRRAIFEGLSLEVGPRYFTLVRAYDRGGPETRVSPEARSDGFVVIGAEGPTVEVTVAPDKIWRTGEGAPGETAIHFVARDDVGLRSYALRVEAADGSIVRAELAGGPAAGIQRVVDSSWAAEDDAGDPVPVGRYAVVGAAEDLAGHVAEARADVIVCGVGAPPEFGCDDIPDAGMPDSGGVDAAEGTLAGGGGCGCAIHGAPGHAGWIPMLLLVGMLWRRRRRFR